MTKRLLTPSRLACHHEAAMHRRMAWFVARGDVASAKRVRAALKDVSEIRAKAAATEASGAYLN